MSTLLLLAGLLATLPQARTQAVPQNPSGLQKFGFAVSKPGLIIGQTLPLKTFTAGNDSFASVNAEKDQTAVAAGYKFVRVEGYLFSQAQPGTVPLKLYWHPGGNKELPSASTGRLASTDRIAVMHQCRLPDYFTAANPESAREAEAAGYRMVRIEGYLYSLPHPDTVPLKTFWSLTQNDNLATATPEGERAALAAGYQFVRIEGYILRRPK